MSIEFLNCDEVVEIHRLLTEDAKNTEDPISPPGIKDLDLLESAISRQLFGLGGKLKYGTPYSNAATLCYGVCLNHAFYNGNKRTALVSMMCHLDKNNLTFKQGVDQDTLYELMKKLAGHNLVPKKKMKKSSNLSDLEVEELARWLKRNTRKVVKNERTITYQEFERILNDNHVYLKNKRNNYADVIQTKIIKEKRMFRKEKVKIEEVKIANIPYWPGRTVGKKLIKSVRQKAGLTHHQGVDSNLFYGDVMTPDDFIQKYQKVLRKLAKT